MTSKATPGAVLDPPYADVPALLARAEELFSRTLDPQPPSADPGNWLVDAGRWRADYAAARPALQSPRGAVITIVEELRPGADINDAAGVLIPTRVEINGIPLLVTEEGPIIDKIDTRSDANNSATVTLTMFARRVLVDARRGPQQLTAN